MINPIEADQLADTLADQLRVRMSYHSVRLDTMDQDEVRNFIRQVLSNYESHELMQGNQDAKS